MLFFNPAILLPDPSVAVKPPPQGNQGFVIQEALKEVGSLVQKKFDVDALKKESNLLADYVQNKSPELSSYLRESASGFNIGTTDPNQVRGNLLKGTLGLLEMEQNDRKMEATAAMSGQYNMYGTKLTNDQKEYSDAVNAFNAFEKEQNDLEAASKKQNEYLISQGLNPTPYSRRANPHKERMDRARVNFDATRSSTPSVVPKKSSVNVGGDYNEPLLPADGAPSPDVTLLKVGDPAPAAMLPDQPAVLAGTKSAAGAVPDGGLITETIPDESVATPGQSAVTAGVEPPLLITDRTPVAPVGTNSVLKPAPTSSVLQQPDPAINPMIAEATAIRKTNTDFIARKADAIVNQLTENKNYYLNPEAYAKVSAEAKDIIDKIEKTPGAGTKQWTDNADNLLGILEDRVTKLAKNTESQERKDTVIEGQKPIQFKVVGSTTGQTFNGYIRTIDGIPNYYTLRNGVVENVTRQFEIKNYELINTTANGVSVTEPKASIPSSMDALIKKGK